jgi:dTDP-4-amino-4,6-dideoxygalactose transaminase
MIDKYTWVDKGSSYLMSDINAAVLTAQLEHAEVIQQRRHQAFQAYMEGLSDWADKIGAQLPHHLAREDRPAHLFPILMPSLHSRTELINFAKERSIGLTFHYVPLHYSPAGLNFGQVLGDLSQTKRISDSLLRLPLFSGLQDQDIDLIIETISGFDIG